MSVNSKLFEAQVKGLVGMAKMLAAQIGIKGLTESDIAPGDSLAAALDQVKELGTADSHMTRLTAEISGRPAVLLLVVGPQK